jgi:hypothetical protein
MTRFSTIAAVFLTGAFVTLLVSLLTPPHSAVIRADACEFDDATRERVVSYHCFKGTFSTALELLANGEIALEEARARVYESALCYNPGYLQHLADCERGATPQERVARNLIGHLRSRQAENPAIRARVHALELELAELRRRATIVASPKNQTCVRKSLARWRFIGYHQGIRSRRPRSQAESP